jgi:hypothetical protein
MKTGNPIDGMYFFLLLIPFLVSLWSGAIIREKIVTHLMVQTGCSNRITSLAGIFAESVILFFGIILGIFLVELF